MTTATQSAPARSTRSAQPVCAPREPAFCDLLDKLGAARAQAYPISRWYLRPLAGHAARGLCRTAIRPTHLTLAGLAVGLTAAAVLWLRPELTVVAGLLVLVAWFFDRTDGQLARCQQTVSRFGAWLDGNVDEIHDVVWHVAAAGAAAQLTGTATPWALAITFLAGKYLFMHGLFSEQAIPADHSSQNTDLAPENHPDTINAATARPSWLRQLYHLPANADVRLHLLVVALLTGWLTAELALVAAYYNARWLVRCGLVARRLGGAP